LRRIAEKIATIMSDTFGCGGAETGERQRAGFSRSSLRGPEKLPTRAANFPDRDENNACFDAREFSGIM
jgi:hypothetical protein